MSVKVTNVKPPSVALDDNALYSKFHFVCPMEWDPNEG